jgi:hypothetical protein
MNKIKFNTVQNVTERKFKFRACAVCVCVGRKGDAHSSQFPLDDGFCYHCVRHIQAKLA